MVSSKTWHAGGPHTLRKEEMYVILSNRIDQKQITVAENKLLVLKKYVPRNNSPDLPVARNITSQILIVQQYEQETIRRIIVILKKRKSHFSHQTY